MSIHHKAYRFRMRPTPTQEKILNQMAGARRFVWNWALRRWKDYYADTGKTIDFCQLSAELTALKQQPGYEWLNEMSAQSLQQVLRDLRRSFNKFFEGGGSKRTRHPKFKSRKRGKVTFRIPQKVKVDDNHIYVAKIGWIRIWQSQDIDGVIKFATFKREGDNSWYAIVTVKFEIPDVSVPISNSGATIGIDLGLIDFVTVSDGSPPIPPLKSHRKSANKIRRIQRRKDRRQVGSKRRDKTKKRLARVHQKVRNQRQDFLHKLSTDLVNNHEAICIEDLNLAGLARTKLAKSFSDAAMGEFRRQLTYKCEWNRKTLVVVNRFFPSSKTCNTCGMINDGLTLADRQWSCGCGAINDRDLNAARNIRDEGLRMIGRGTPKSDAQGASIRPGTSGLLALN